MLVKLGPIFPKFAGYKIKKSKTYVYIYTWYVYTQSTTHYPLFFKLNWAPLLWYFHQQLSPVKKPHAMMVESVGVAPGGSWSKERISQSTKWRRQTLFGFFPLEFSFQVFFVRKNKHTMNPWFSSIYSFNVFFSFFEGRIWSGKFDTWNLLQG